MNQNETEVAYGVMDDVVELAGLKKCYVCF